MKAPSDILTSVQKPFFVFGMPFKLFGLVAGLGIMTFLILGSLKLQVLAFIMSGVVIVCGSFALRRATQRDCHVEQRILIGRPFFKGRSFRHLTPGIPRKKKPKKERAY